MAKDIDRYIWVEGLCMIFVLNIPFRVFTGQNIPLWQLACGIIAFIIAIIIELKHRRERLENKKRN